MVVKIKTSTIAGFLAVLFILGGAVYMAPKIKEGKLPGFQSASIVQTAQAQEIYPMFLCPCCGEPLDKKNICCDMAKERIAYIDSLAGEGKSKDEIVLAYAQKYGADSFADKEKQKEFKRKLIAAAPADRPIIAITPENIDFGNVSWKRGTVSVFFGIKNEGKKDLTITKLDTSCGCTSASIVYNGKEGPRFAMEGHGIKSPESWKLVLPPGESGQIKVYYDPNVHPDFRGYAIREITVFSSDPIDFEKKIQVELTQVD